MTAGNPYEWGVLHARTSEVHRTGMDEIAARQWVSEWENDGGKVGVIVVIRRRVGEWEQP